MLKKIIEIKNLGITGVPIKYKWSDSHAIRFTDIRSDKLYTAIDELSYKAKMAYGALILEIIANRFEGHTDLSSFNFYVEAAWACALDPKYTNQLKYNFGSIADDLHETNPVDGPLNQAVYLLIRGIVARCLEGDIYLALPLVRLTMLARHVLPKKKFFGNWISTTLRKTANVFPRGVEYDEDTEYYDASNELPVPRDFFEADFDYNEANAKQAINEFLQSLDYKTNPYLKTPEEMIAAGFKGTPYQY